MIIIGVGAAVVGLFVSFYIYLSKKSKKPLVCPRKMPNCDQVVTSKYGTTFGISNATLGMVFYLLMIVQFLLISIGFVFPFQMNALLLFATGGFLFSLYLIYIQAFVLRLWCLWCFVSAIASTTIFLAALFL